MDNIKPTLKVPTKHGKEVDKGFDSIINEIDSSLTEDEKKEKETLFNLSKMEYLVHNDPDLSEYYQEMVEDKKDFYGYHYNEAIMNIIFNTKVLKNGKYLRKYKQAPAKKKKRRDKYGIEDLKTPETKRREEKEKEKEKKETNETTSSGASGQYATAHAWSGNGQPKMSKPIWHGGAIIQESNYITNPKLFKEMLNFINENFTSINEHHLDSKEEKVAFIIKNKGDEYKDIEKLDSMSDEEVDNIYNKIEKEMGLVEETDNTLNEIDNQTFFNSIGKMRDKNQLGRKKSLTKTFFNEFIGKPMLGSTINDFDSDYYIPNTGNEEDKVFGVAIYLENGEEITYNVNLDTGEDKFVLPKDSKTKKQKTISRKDARTLGKIAKKVNVRSNYTMGTGDFNISDYANTNESNEVINEHHLDSKEDRIEFIVSNTGDKYGDQATLNGLNDNTIEAIYLNVEKEMGIDDEVNVDDIPDENLEESSMLDPLPDTMGMSNDREDSMKVSKPNSTSSIQGMDNVMEELQKDIDFLNDLKENRRPSALIQLDRLKEKNQANFKSDVRKIDDIEMAKDQYTDIDFEDSKELGQEIEKEVLKKTKGESFKNVGNSTNKKGDEIPKRNQTDDEIDEIDEIRDGMHTIAYDSKPDERFEERMKADMGDDLYNKRQKRLEAQTDEPMYNKDTQPVSDGDNKKQYNKYMKNIKESLISGKYKNDFNKTVFVNFELGKAKIVESVDLDSFKPINIEGMGNFRTNKFEVNESAVTTLKNKSFFINEETKEIVSMEKGKQKLIKESKETLQKRNQDFDKMKKLFDYNPSKYIDTTVSKSSIK